VVFKPDGARKEAEKSPGLGERADDVPRGKSWVVLKGRTGKRRVLVRDRGPGGEKRGKEKRGETRKMSWERKGKEIIDQRDCPRGGKGRGV